MNYFWYNLSKNVGVLHFGGDLDYVGDFLMSCFL